MRMENDGHWSDPDINGPRKNQRTWNMYKNSAQTAKPLTLFIPKVKDSRIVMSIPLVAAILQPQTFMMVKQREGRPMETFEKNTPGHAKADQTRRFRPLLSIGRPAWLGPSLERLVYAAATMDSNTFHAYHLVFQHVPT